MKIDVLQKTLTATSPLTVILDDQGGAHVSITLVIGNFTEITHKETYTGSLTRTLFVPKGVYDCTIAIYVFKTGALGPTYDSGITLNGTKVAIAKGELSNAEIGDHAFGDFTLKIQ